MNPRHLAMAAAGVIAATIILTLLWSLILPSPPVTAGAVTTASPRYVSLTGTDSGDCTDSTYPCRTVQYAVDQADEGSVIKVASGVYTDIHHRDNITQMVYISKSVTIRGGYSASNWTRRGPDAQMTTLNPQRQGRVMVITGSITVTVEGFYITGGDATGQQAPSNGDGADCGGAIHVTRARFAMSGTIIIGNTAPHYGGGLWVGDGDSLLLTHSEIISNDVTGDTMLGGGVYAHRTEDVIITHSTLLGNRGLGDNAGGAAAGLEHCPGATIRHNDISHNHASGAYGGLIMGWCDGAILSDNNILDNTAGGHGGGVGIGASRSITIKNNLIIANYAGNDGGGVSIHDHSTVALDNNIIVDNQLTDGGSGAGVYIAHSQCDGRHNTIARNSGVDGSGVFVTGDAEAPGTAALTNTILLGHTVGITVAGGNTATLEATLWGSGAWANGTDWNGDGAVGTGMVNVWGDPAFVEPDSRDYHIGIDSAAFDAGVDAGISVDIDGEPRPAGGGYDIGADEYPAGIVYRHTVGPIAKGGPCTSVYTITNQSDSWANMVHQFYDRSDEEIHILFDTVAAGTSLVYDLADIDEIPDGYAGYAVIVADEPFTYTLQACPILTRTCWARLNDDPTDYATVQAAVDAADENDLVKIAGHCRGVEMRDGVSQIVYISKTLTLQGGYTTTNWATSNPGVNHTTLDAQSQGRVFYITAPDSGASISPVITGLRITGGDSAGLGGGQGNEEAGGGVYVVTATVTLTDCQITANTIDTLLSYGGTGGGIYLRNSPNTTLRGNSIKDNTGGGVYMSLSPNATLSGNTIQDNGTDDSGGGVYLTASDNAVLIGNMIQGNAAGGLVTVGGGGVYVTDSDNAVLTGNIIQGNYIGGFGGIGGGGVFLSGSNNATLSDNTIQDNETGGSSHAGGTGGGVLLWDSSSATLSGNSVQGNIAPGRMFPGSGISLWDSNNIMLDNNVIVDNQVGTAGSGIYMAGSTAHLRHTTLARNGGGSGVYVTDDWYGETYSAVALTNTVLVSHTRGIIVTGGSTATLTGVLWHENEANTGGLGTLSVTHQITGSPAFAADGYHITLESAALDAGVDAGITADIDGEPRPIGKGYDIGADELFAALRVMKQANPTLVEPGARLTYTIRATNTGLVDLHAVITDVLPLSITLTETSGGRLLLPGGGIGITWTAIMTTRGGIWNETLVVTVAEDCEGPLTNLVQVTTEEGARGIYAETSAVSSHSIYLPVVLKSWPPMPPTIRMSGRVTLEDGTGLVGVGIYSGVRYGGPSGGSLVTITDQDGYYRCDLNCPVGHDETLRMYAALEEYTFEPEVVNWRTSGYCQDIQVDFVAFPAHTSTP